MKKVMLGLIHFYQKRISPHFPPMCRFYPTCSSYAVMAIERYGALRGGCMAAWRLLRCNPLNPGGYDPVPERKNKTNETGREEPELKEIDGGME